LTRPTGILTMGFGKKWNRETDELIRERLKKTCLLPEKQSLKEVHMSTSREG